jgi:streptogramin lyase
VLGRLDPKTGSVERIPLGKGSAPHGVIIGPDGGAWVTDSGLNAIVRVDPTTKGVKVWPLPKAGINANLNTAALDGKGRIWFTGQAWHLRSPRSENRRHGRVGRAEKASAPTASPPRRKARSIMCHWQGAILASQTWRPV